VNEDRLKNVKSKLIEMDKMQDRYHNPHLLSLGFIISKNESPHMNRFLTINRSPEVLSQVKRVSSPSLNGYSPRKGIEVVSNCVQNCYDYNIDSVKKNPNKSALDFSRITSRKTDLMDGSGFRGIINYSNVTTGKDTILPNQQVPGYLEFDKIKGREWLEDLSTATGSSTPKPLKVDFTDYLPNSIKRKMLGKNQKYGGRHIVRDAGLQSIIKTSNRDNSLQVSHNNSISIEM